MSIIVYTWGSCIRGEGKWSYQVYEGDSKEQPLLFHYEEGASSGTTSRQMSLMAILRALDYARTLTPTERVVVKSDCRWCVRCLNREYDCVSDNKFKTDRVTRGHVQYIREIWWKASGLDVRFEVMEESTNGLPAG